MNLTFNLGIMCQNTGLSYICRRLLLDCDSDTCQVGLLEHTFSIHKVSQLLGIKLYIGNFKLIFYSKFQLIFSIIWIWDLTSLYFDCKYVPELVAILVCLMIIAGLMHNSKRHHLWLWYSFLPGTSLAIFWLHHMLRWAVNISSKFLLLNIWLHFWMRNSEITEVYTDYVWLQFWIVIN